MRTFFWFAALFSLSTHAEYIQVTIGDLPIVVAHAHDGTIEPPGWPDRTDGCLIPPSTSDCSWGPICDSHTRDASNCGARTLRDTYTRAVAQHAMDTLHNMTGALPTVVVNTARRSKLDANRALPEAAQGFPAAEAAWSEYHAAIGNATQRAVASACGSALVLDMHGQAHAHGWVELGYSLWSSKLEASDSTMTAAPASYADLSTVRHATRLAAAAPAGYNFTSILRDTPAANPVQPQQRVSLGGMLEDAGFASVPSNMRPDPQGQSYFSGGYTSQRWSSKDADPSSYLCNVDAIQVEMPRWIRWGNSSVQRQFGTALGAAVLHWVQRNHRVKLTGSDACWAAVPQPSSSVSPTASPAALPNATVSASTSPSVPPSQLPSATVTATAAAAVSATASGSASAAPSTAQLPPGNAQTSTDSTGGELGTAGIVGIAAGVAVLCSVLLFAAWRLGVCGSSKQQVKAASNSSKYSASAQGQGGEDEHIELTKTDSGSNLMTSPIHQQHV